jgi:hypothetical protein
MMALYGVSNGGQLKPKKEKPSKRRKFFKPKNAF